MEVDRNGSEIGNLFVMNDYANQNMDLRSDICNNLTDRKRKPLNHLVSSFMISSGSKAGGPCKMPDDKICQRSERI